MPSPAPEQHLCFGRTLKTLWLDDKTGSNLELRASCIGISIKTTTLYAAQNKSRIDIGRLQRLSSAFGRYTVSGLTVTNPAAGGPVVAGEPSTPVLDGTAKEALKLVFSREGSYAQVIPKPQTETLN